MTKKSLIFILFALSMSASLRATTYIVPDDQPSIHAAITLASTGDSIFVREGVYRENLSITGKGLYISSFFTTPNLENMRETIIDGDQHGPVIDILDCVDTTTIRGFTLCNGLHHHGAGINCSGSNIRLDDMVIRENETTMYTYNGGGGIYATDTSFIKLENVLITLNKAFDFGGGIDVRNTSTVIGNNVVITGNTVGGGGHQKGGGVYADIYSQVYLERSVIDNNIAGFWGGGVAACGNGGSLISLVNVTMSGNFAGYGGGAVYSCYGENHIFLGNCILKGNLADIVYPMDQEVYFDDNGFDNRLAFVASDIHGGLPGMYIPYHSSATDLQGNIDLLPYFNPDLTLASPSPCIDAGIVYFEYWNEVLIDIPADQYWGAAPDMGAFENWDVVLNTPEITNQKAESQVKVYPNPALDLLNVSVMNESGGKIQIVFLDGQGKVVMEKKQRVSKNELSIIHLNTSGLAPGLYILEVRMKDQLASEKVLLN